MYIISVVFVSNLSNVSISYTILLSHTIYIYSKLFWYFETIQGCFVDFVLVLSKIGIKIIFF